MWLFEIEMPNRLENLLRQASSLCQWDRLRSNFKAVEIPPFLCNITNMAKEKQVVFKNTPMVDASPKRVNEEVSNFERSLITKYIRGVSKINNNLPKSDDDIKISSLNNNFFYDSYSVSFGDVESYCEFILKISLDPENKRLEREHFALEAVNNLVSPSHIDYTFDVDKNVEFLLTSYENGKSFEYFCDDDFMYNLGNFASTLDVIHESDTKNIISFEEKFEENSSILSLKDLVDEKEVRIFEQLVDLTFEDIDSIFLNIKENFLSQYVEEIPVLCHSNVKHSNILYKDDSIKIINFQECHVSDLYYSLLKCVNNTYMYYSDKKTKTFLKKYYNYSILLGDMKFRTFEKRYESKKEVNRVLLFQDLICKTLFHFFAYGAFTRKKQLNHYMYIYLNLKPTIQKFFPDKIKSFDKLFFTPMPNVETYNAEEIKILLEIDD